MIIRTVLALALLLPVAVRAEDMFRWRDAKGRIHYSNDTEKVPAGAQPVTKQLGMIGGTPIGDVVEVGRAEAPRAAFQPRGTCVTDIGLWALPHRSVDFDRRNWFDIDLVCGPQHDIEGWLRRASTQLELRKIGL